MKSLLICFGVLFFIHILGLSAQVMPDMDLSLKMSKVTNISGLCELMRVPDCEKVLDGMEPDEAVDETGEKMVVSGGVAEKKSKIAVFDACDPRLMTIALPRHPDHSITIWPTCTRAFRCGGCCTSEVFSCEPTKTTESYVKVFDTRIPYLGAQRFQFLGLRLVKVIEHMECEAQCKTKQHECHKYQRYEARNCRCECRKERLKLKSTCSSVQIWDDSECDCVCPNRNTASCPEPSYFSTTTCKCTLKTEVTGEIDLAVLFEQLLTTGTIGGLNNKLINNPTNENDIYAEEIDTFAAAADTFGEGNAENEDGDLEADTEEGESSNVDDETIQVENDTIKNEEVDSDEEDTDEVSQVESGPESGNEVQNEIPTDEEGAAEDVEEEEEQELPIQLPTPTPKPKPKPKDCSEKKCAGEWVPKLFRNTCWCFPPSRL